MCIWRGQWWTFGELRHSAHNTHLHSSSVLSSFVIIDRHYKNNIWIEFSTFARNSRSVLSFQTISIVDWGTFMYFEYILNICLHMLPFKWNRKARKRTNSMIRAAASTFEIYVNLIDLLPFTERSKTFYIWEISEAIGTDSHVRYIQSNIEPSNPWPLNTMMGNWKENIIRQQSKRISLNPISNWKKKHEEAFVFDVTFRT